MIWNPQVECASRKEIAALQLERFKASMAYTYENVPFYRQRMDAAGLKPEKITSIKDLERMPFTTKDDLRDHYPYGLFAVPMKKIVRIHASSGTTGRPTVVGYTKNDIKMWAELISRIACQAGATDEDIAQIAFGYGLFTGAFGLHYGLENMGVTVIPMSSGNTERQIKIMQDFGSTMLISTPAYALYMAEVARQMGVRPGIDVKLRLGMFGGEGSTEQMRSEIMKSWKIFATENYGLSEIIGPGVSGECTALCGMHLAEDHFIAEIINPETGKVLPLGETGELVLTTITKEGLPMIRYRTKDITYLSDEPCACGRTSMRMAKVQGRSDDMLIIRGVNVFPSQIEEVLLAMEEVGPHYEIILTRQGYMDRLEVRVEVLDAALLDSFAALEKLQNKIHTNLRAMLSIDAKVTLVEPNTLRRFEGKAKRVIDMRDAQN
nr:phenylacetate--CoA ligase [Maliibacterium massiliense]